MSIILRKRVALSAVLALLALLGLVTLVLGDAALVRMLWQRAPLALCTGAAFLALSMLAAHLAFALSAAHRRYEHALSRSERMHRALVEGQSELIALIEADGSLRFGNPAFMQAVNAAAGGALDGSPEKASSGAAHVASPTDCIDPLDRPRMHEAIRAAFAGTQAVALDCRAPQAGRWLSWRLTGRGGGADRLVLAVGRDVTLRKEREAALQMREAALRSSEELLRRTNEVAGVGGWEIDLATSQLTWSTQLRRIHGVSQDEVPTIERALAFYTPEGQRELRQVLAEAHRRHTAWDLELPATTAGGRSIYVRVVGEAECREDGTPHRLIGAIQDITERKRLEFRLEASERFIRSITDSVPARIAYLAADGRFLFVNRTVARRFGMSHLQLVGRCVLDIVPPVARPVWEELLAGAAQGEPRRYEYDDPLGEDVRKIEVQMTPDFNERGEVRGLVAIGNDITHLKRIEHELREATAHLSERTQALEQSREMFRLIAESTKAVPFTLDLTAGCFLYLGSQGVESFRLRPADGTGLHSLESTLPRAENGELRQRLDALEEGAFEFLSPIQYPDGRQIEMRWTGTCATTGGHKLLRGLMLDVTELRRLERELQAAQKLESVGRLAAGVAHEINTPVQYVSNNVEFVTSSMAAISTVMRTYRELKAAIEAGADTSAAAAAVERAESGEDIVYVLDNVAPALEAAIEGLVRIATIVRSMQEFAHPDQTERTMVDLNHAIQTTLIVARGEYKYVADLETDLQELPPVSCYLGEFNQVILNLLVNAADAIKDVVQATGERGKLTVRSRALDGQVEISITDTGTGIAPSAQERIFDPFFTTKPVGRGTGQGLAIARSVIVNKHGGTLRFETDMGRGTTFFIRLPVDAPDAPPRPHEHTHCA